MTLLEEIQEAAASNSMDLATLLRKCHILAARLNIKPAEDWLEWELDGYPSEVKVPGYRVLPMELKGNFVGAFQQLPGYTIPPGLVPERIRKDVGVMEYRRSIGSIEHLMSKSTPSSSLTVPMGDLALALGEDVLQGMQCVAAWGVVGTAGMADILNTVRNRVLKFSLELAKQAPNAGEPGQKASKDVQAMASQVFHMTINGNPNFVGLAQNSTVTFNITQGDFSSLQKALTEKGVSHSDLLELKEALEAEPIPTKQGFGKRVSGWIAKMTMKAADGTWQIGLGAAGNLLATAIGKYYGAP